jgi:hypothetical protein
MIAGSALETSKSVLDYGPWDDSLCDPDHTVVGSLYLPIGDWPEGNMPAETQMLKHAGVLMQQNFLNIHTAFHSIMLRHGMDQETLNEWSRRTTHGELSFLFIFFVHI